MKLVRISFNKKEFEDAIYTASNCAATLLIISREDAKDIANFVFNKPRKTKFEFKARR